LPTQTDKRVPLQCLQAPTRRRQGMESVVGERISSFESTLALGAAIALGLYNQNRAAQRAVRWTHDPSHLRSRVTHQLLRAHRPGKRGERLGCTKTPAITVRRTWQRGELRGCTRTPSHCVQPNRCHAQGRRACQAHDGRVLRPQPAGWWLANRAKRTLARAWRCETIAGPQHCWTGTDAGGWRR
jgi:hypothetical protein